MPTIGPSQLRSLAQSLAQDGRLAEQELKQLVDSALGSDARLAPELKAELEKVLVDFKDQLELGGGKARLQAFLDVKDPGLQALTWRLSQDSIISTDDAQKLIDLAKQDGAISGDERFSLAAVMLAATLSPEARQKIAAEAQLETVKVERSPRLAIPDNDPRGASDKVTVDAQGRIADLAVTVDLDHTWRGDLTLKLIAPDGTEVKLHDKAGRSADHLKGTYPGTLTPAESLDKLIGKGAAGEWTLHVVDSAGQDVGTLNSWSLDLKTVGKGEAPPPAGGTVDLGATGNHRATHMLESGVFVADPAITNPGPADIATGLFHMASLVDDKKTNPFTDAGLTLAQKEKVFDRLKESLEAVPPDGTRWPTELTEVQALQQRSSTVTTLLGLIESLGNAADDAVLKQNAFRAYTDALKAEQNPVLRDSMIWNLVQAKPGLTPSMKDKVEDLAEAIAPEKPPYDDWFKDGNNQLNVTWTCGQGEDFFGGTLELLAKKGFTPEDPNDKTPPAWFTKTITNAEGVETLVRIKVALNNNSIFADMDDKDTHIVGYDGHSDIGRNVPASLKRGDPEQGKKLIFTGLCAGKDTLHRMRGQYPNAQLLTTFNSSYFNTRDDNGRKVLTRSENFNVLMELVEGAAHRRTWTELNQNITQKAVLFPWSHPMPGGNNYISPAHTQIRRQVLDSDHDGQADYLDKLVNFDTHKIAQDTHREWQPLDPGRPADVLDGTVTHMAAMALNTATGYNTETQSWKKQNILGQGYFEPEAGETRIVKFEKSKIEGKDVLLMRVNKDYAHMSVEGLRAIAHYEFMRETLPSRGLNAVDQKLMGLVFAGFSINYDEQMWGRDNAIWDGLLAHLGLPADLPLSPLKRLLDDEHHDYSGNRTIVQKWKEQIPQAALDALAA